MLFFIWNCFLGLWLWFFPRPVRKQLIEIYPPVLKIVVVGDSGVGKTCLVNAVEPTSIYALNHIPTIGVEFTQKIITVDHSQYTTRPPEALNLQIWDTAG